MVYLLSLLILFSSFPAHAEEGGNATGGGDAVRLDVMAVRDYIYKYCDQWRSLRTRHIDPKKLRASMDRVGLKENVQILDSVTPPYADIQLASYYEKGNPPKIKVNRRLWLATKTDLAKKIGILSASYLELIPGISLDGEIINDIVAEYFYNSQLGKLPKGSAPTRGKTPPADCPAPEITTAPRDFTDQADALVDFSAKISADEIRLDAIGIRNYIYEAAEEWDSLKKAGVSAGTLRAKMDEVGVGEKFKLQSVVSLADGVARSGINHPAVPEVIFSESFWIQDSADPIRKIGIELHEYLGLMGLEGTDDYKISGQVVAELRRKAEAGLLPAQFWHPKPEFESIPGETTTCPNFSGLWNSRRPIFVKQKGCQALTMNRIIFKGKHYDWANLIGEPITSEIGKNKQRQELLVSNVMLDARAGTYAVTYSARYENGRFVEESKSGAKGDGCLDKRTVLYLKDQDTLVRETLDRCEKKPKTEKETFRRFK